MMSANVAETYKQTLSPENIQGTFVHSSFSGSYEKTCFILEEVGDEFLIEFFDENVGLSQRRYVRKADVTLDVEQTEKVYYVVKNPQTGDYHRATNSASSCPNIYRSKGKAEARRKQKRDPDNWVIMKWDITETKA
jgi:hypothetical protein